MPTRPARQLDELLAEALACPAAERSALLERVCGSDAELLAEMQMLLRLHAAARDFLEEPAVLALEADFGRDEPPEAADAGGSAGDARVGPYKLLEPLGEGGFGTVYVAEQERPVRRRVALKLIKPGMDSKEVIARFEAERQALAMMDHPNIARVLDAGATDAASPAGPGRPYFVMELVAGVAITRFCDEQRLTIRERLALFEDVCGAVQHAHQKGIIHRDLKPSNILVSAGDSGFGVQRVERGGRPGALNPESRTPHPVIKVIDFGIAKAMHGRLTDKTLLTEFRQLIGTPAYMSPEQAQLGAGDVDTRSDIYSLGVLLYELLTGVTPFDAKLLFSAGYDEMRRIIREVEPPRPSTRVSALRARQAGSGAGDAGSDMQTAAAGAELRAPIPAPSSAIEIAAHRHTDPAALARLLHGDLDWIVMKCLEKDRARRYQTAGGLAADVARHLAGEAVTAAPPSRLYRARKIVRRHSVGFAFAGTVAGLLIGATAVSLTLWRQARDSATTAARHADETELAATLLTDLIGKSDPRDTHIPNLLMRQRLDEFAAGLGPKLAGHPEVEARVRLALGGAYRGIRSLDRAELHQARALALYRELHGPEHPTVATALSEWADLLYLKGDLAAAEALHREVLAMRRRMLGEVHIDVAQSLDLLGSVLADRADWIESEAVLRESLAIVERLYGPDDVEATGTLERLFATLVGAARYDEAEFAGRRALALDERYFGADHARTTWVQFLLGETLALDGRADEGLELMQTARETHRRAYPGDELLFWRRCVRLGNVLGTLGRPREALAENERAAEICQRLFPGDHPEVARGMIRSSSCLQDLGRSEEALQKSEAALAMMQRVYPDDHADVALCLNNVGQCLQMALNRPAEALPKFEAALAMRQRLYDGDHLDIAVSLWNVGYSLLALGRAGEALPRYEAALQMYQRLYPGDHPKVAEALIGTAGCLDALGRLGDAAERYEAALAMNRRRLPAGDLGIASTLGPLTLILLKQADFSKAEPLLRECLDIRRAKLPPDHWLRFNTMSMLAGALAGQASSTALATETRLAKLAEAEPLVIAGYQGLKDSPEVPPGVGARRIREALERIIALYEIWDRLAPDTGRAEKAAEWRAQLEPDAPPRNSGNSP